MESNESICPVLIIDDDNDLCTILGAVINDKCDVHVEHSLKNAEEYLSHFKPTLVLLDNNLPDGTGVKRIRDILGLYPDVKIVLMTADASTDLKEKAMCEGAFQFIKKPFRASLINEIISTICPRLRVA